MASQAVTSTPIRGLTTALATMPFQTYTGIVVSAGKMDKTIKVRVAAQKWNRKIQKYYSAPISHLVHDPNNSCREGDVVSIRSGWRVAKQVRHVVTGIVAPMGEPVSQRPKVLSEWERLEEAERRRAAKDGRQAARGRREAIERIKVREEEERFLKHVEKMAAQRKERMSPEEMGDVDGELRGAIDALKREVEDMQVKRLREAMEELRVLYEKARGVNQTKLRETDWMRVILGEESTMARIVAMMRDGKWSESEILAEGVDLVDYWKANNIREKIFTNAQIYQKQKKEMWEKVAKLFEAETQLAKQRDAAALKLSSDKTLDDDAAAPLNTQLQSCHTAIGKIRALNDTDPRNLNMAKTLSGLSDILETTTLPLTNTSLEPNSPWHAQLDAMRTLLFLFTAKSSALQAQIDSSSPQPSETRKSLLALAKAHYDAEAQKLQSTIAKFEKVEAFVERYPKVKELPTQFHLVLKKVQLPDKAIDKARDAFARFPVKGDEKEVQSTADSVGVGEGVEEEKGGEAAQAKAKAAVISGAVEAQKEEAEKVESGEKELPPSADLPEGKHSVGPIDEMAQQNKQEAMKLEEKAIENEGEARELEKEKKAEEESQVGEEKRKEVEEKRKEVEEKRKEVEEKRKEVEEKRGGMFGWFRRS